MQTKRFQRRIENFVCEHCGAEVKGNGYTDHCPKCLWSKHVDINPGDRADACQGMMEPIGLEGSTPDYRIVERCERCNATRRISIAKEDDMQAVLKLAGSR